MRADYLRYWGKAMPNDGQGSRFHLLAYHSLDVAACGKFLLALPQFSLRPLADMLGWPVVKLDALFVYFLALHDVGKFSRAFQGLARDLSADLVSADASPLNTPRHDTLGWWLWRTLDADELLSELFSDPALSEFWAIWMRTVAGHHGMPPKESENGGLIVADAGDYFLRADREAARAFMDAVFRLLLAEHGALPRIERTHRLILKRHTWRLAGLAVLADWLGSNQAYFPYQSQPMPLSEYWLVAMQRAGKAVASAGLATHDIRRWENPLNLFDYLKSPTPLQQYAATVALEEGPQLFLLEDVTGAGKTEAALLLCQRLMQAGRAQGLYFALPSMATANQMYQRVGAVYGKLYGAEPVPSLILAHGARGLVDGFRQSVLHGAEQVADRAYQENDQTATAQCSAWLADNNKKALLAEVGVGTLDQALLAVLPARHQSLRLLGLANKVLLVDEVHAYDAYMMRLLQTLLTAHARQGGSVILLSATLPLDERARLLAAYQSGLADADIQRLDDARYPLATRVGAGLMAHACETRPQVKRHVAVRFLHDEATAVALVAEQAKSGRCVGWIRNTVDDARRAAMALMSCLAPDKVLLFHGRYAMGHRLDIEDDVLRRFGKQSLGAERAGRVLIGTQVLEQSLDFDVDVLLTDLAPIDLIIQRAGRLQRHVRSRSGDPALDGIEGRDKPVLYVLSPEVDEAPARDWYAAMFEKGRYVYPDIGRLWLGARALQRAGCIVSPGEPGQAGGVRSLVEAVYGEGNEAIPGALQEFSNTVEGKELAMQSQASFNALYLDRGYCVDSSARWYEDDRVPTRLGDASLTVYLAYWRDGELHPLCADKARPWEQSAVRIPATRAKSLSPAWQARFDGSLSVLRGAHPLLREPAFILPLSEEGGVLQSEVVDARGKTLRMRYSVKDGVVWE